MELEFGLLQDLRGSLLTTPTWQMRRFPLSHLIQQGSIKPGCCFYFFYLASVTKRWPQNQCIGRKGFIGLTYLCHCPSLGEIRAIRWKLDTGSCRQKRKQSPGGKLLTGLPSCTCSACFLRQLRSSCLRAAPPTVGWAIPCQSLVKRMPPQRFPEAKMRKAKLQLRFWLSSQLPLVCIKLTKTNQPSIQKFPLLT